MNRWSLAVVLATPLMAADAMDSAAYSQPGKELATRAARAALPSLQRRLPDRKSTRLNSSHIQKSRMPSSA